jgi:hypothetical protein
MTFVNQQKREILTRFLKRHYPLPRRKELDFEINNVVTDYLAKRDTGKPFEARGLYVTGESRTGKTKEINTAIESFNTGGTRLPDGLTARFVQCTLSGMLSWKDLGIEVLDSLGFPMAAQRNQSYIWNEVVKQARLQGVIGIHFDECQHMFTETGKITNDKVLDGFKSLCKNKHWPFVLILSGVPALAGFVNGYDQLRELLKPVHFGLIQYPKDIAEVNNLCFAYADHGDIEFEPLAKRDFYERLAFANGYRWGLVIEMLIEALTLCKLDGRTEIDIIYFEQAFARKTGIPFGFSPFSVDDYEEAFSPAEVLRLMTQG